MTTTDRRRLLDANDFRAEQAEAEAYLLASQPQRPTPSKDEQRALDEAQAQLDEAAVKRDAALLARREAIRVCQDAHELERAQRQEGAGLAGLAAWVKGARKVPSLATARAALEECEARFLEAEAVQDRAHRDLTAATARVARKRGVA